MRYLEAAQDTGATGAIQPAPSSELLKQKPVSTETQRQKLIEKFLNTVQARHDFDCAVKHAEALYDPSAFQTEGLLQYEADKVAKGRSALLKEQWDLMSELAKAEASVGLGQQAKLLLDQAIVTASRNGGYEVANNSNLIVLIEVAQEDARHGKIDEAIVIMTECIGLLQERYNESESYTRSKRQFFDPYADAYQHIIEMAESDGSVATSIRKKFASIIATQMPDDRRAYDEDENFPWPLYILQKQLRYGLVDEAREYIDTKLKDPELKARGYVFLAEATKDARLLRTAEKLAGKSKLIFVWIWLRDKRQSDSLRRLRQHSSQFKQQEPGHLRNILLSPRILSTLGIIGISQCNWPKRESSKTLNVLFLSFSMIRHERGPRGRLPKPT